MRKLKFKVWNKKEKNWHMFHNSLALDVNGESVYYMGMDNETEIDPLTVVQFVNVFDMHGKEVYEGDILEYKNLKYDERWSDERKKEFSNKSVVCFTPEGHDFFPGFSMAKLYSHYGDFEIVGNIFENYDIVENDRWLTHYQKDFAYLL